MQMQHVVDDHPALVIELSEDERDLRIHPAEHIRQLIETFR